MILTLKAARDFGKEETSLFLHSDGKPAIAPIWRARQAWSYACPCQGRRIRAAGKPLATTWVWTAAAAAWSGAVITT